MLILYQVSTVALQKGEIRIVQSSMLGAILSNVLLVNNPILQINFQLINGDRGLAVVYLLVAFDKIAISMLLLLKLCLRCWPLLRYL